MTACSPARIRHATAEAALAVNGVLALQPSLASRLAHAASRAIPGTTDDGITSPSSGVLVHHDPDHSVWQVEIRCVLAKGHRAVDVARTVHDRARTSLAPLLAPHDTANALRVTVTVTQITKAPADTRPRDDDVKGSRLEMPPTPFPR